MPSLHQPFIHWPKRSKALRIIVVEDNLSVAKGLRYFLEDAGHAVDLFHDGAEALEFLKDDAADMLVIQRVYRGRNRKVRLAGTGRSDAKNDGRIVDGIDVFALPEGLGANNPPAADRDAAPQEQRDRFPGVGAIPDEIAGRDHGQAGFRVEQGRKRVEIGVSAPEQHQRAVGCFGQLSRSLTARPPC